MPASDSSRWWLAAEVVLGLSLVALPWCFGGAPSWTTMLVLSFGSVALGLWGTGAALNHRRVTWHPVMLLPIFGVLVAGLQLIPSPFAGMVSPPMAQLQAFALEPLGLMHPRAVSMDPPATARALARTLGLGALLATALQLGRLEASRRRLFSILGLSAVSIAACGFIHLLASEEALFGVHHFVATLPLVTPFGNTNHLAAFLSLGAVTNIALSIDARSRDAVIGWASAAVACGVGVLLSYSRGGIGAFAATGVLVGAAVLTRRDVGLRSAIPWGVIGATVVFAGLLAFEQLAQRAETVSSVERLRGTKIELWPMLAQGALHYWPMGMGMGAFELGFARYQTSQLDVTFTHPENIVLQYISEVGVPLSCLLAMLVGWLVYRVWIAARHAAAERYIVLGLLGLLVHDVVDFSLELNALAVCASVVLGLICAVPRPHEEPVRLVARYRVVVASALVALGGLIAFLGGTPAHTDAEALLGEAIRAGRSATEVRAQAVAALDRHPSDWVLYANVARFLSRQGDPRESLAWSNRVLFLRPSDARVHVAAAQALIRLGAPMQALVELKLAWILGDTSSLAIGLGVASRANAWARVLVESRGYLTAAYRHLRSLHRDDDALALLEAAEALPPSEAVQLEARVLRATHEAEVGDARAAILLLDRLPQEEQATVSIQSVRARLLMKLGEADAAIALLDRLMTGQPSEVAVGLELAAMLGGLGRPLAGIEVLERLKPFVSDASARSLLYQREGELLASQERWGGALEAFQTASRIEPSRADLHYRLAQLYEKMGSLHSAIDEVRKGRTLDSRTGASNHDEWLQKLEAAQGSP